MQKKSHAFTAYAKNSKGFTLLELLIVIAIIAILSVVLILVLNPAEMLKKSRDVQRISDLGTLKTALGLYMTSTSTPQLDGVSGTKNDKCVGGGGTDTLYVSVAGVTGSTYPAPFGAWNTSESASVDGTGWVPVNLGAISGGSPISNLPLDPTNSIATLSAPTSTDLMYRYACKSSPLGFELNARLESQAYTSDDNKHAKDGGNNSNLFEVGTDLTILPSTL